jgi:hypothetical protein
VNSINPIKLFEYFACGLPVVSVEWRELQLLQLPITLTDSPSAFVSGVRSAVRQGKRQDLMDLAKRNDASVRFKELISELGVA